MRNDIHYARVKLVVPDGFAKKLKYATPTIVWHINDNVYPLYYSMTQWLEFECSFGTVRVYNPQKLTFSIDKLIENITSHMRYRMHTECWDWSIVQELDNGKVIIQEIKK